MSYTLYSVESGCYYPQGENIRRGSCGHRHRTAAAAAACDAGTGTSRAVVVVNNTTNRSDRRVSPLGVEFRENWQ